MIPVDNLLSGLPGTSEAEVVSVLLSSPHVRIDRIVSTGQASPPDFWYDQDGDEWVLVLTGSAGLAFEGEPDIRILRTGDYVHILAHRRHRLAWTDPDQPTVWLAVHVAPDAA
jgi:cupin 2 domain-containing protein